MSHFMTECDKYGLTVGGTTDGCDGVAVSTVGCGPASPGSIPGHGPIPIFLNWSVNRYIPSYFLPKVHNCVSAHGIWMGCIWVSESRST